ncbi:MAG: hypothetical protein AAB373_02775 [Patescibacteria group bacterium]|mgnify:CR=1 FL=1
MIKIMTSTKSKFLAQFLAGTLGGTVLGITGFINLLNYGGNHGCWPVINQLFNGVGYESCGPFGAIGGILIGFIFGILIISKLKNQDYSKISQVLGLCFLMPFFYVIIMFWPPFGDDDVGFASTAVLAFILVSAIPSLLVTLAINWRKVFKR